MITNLALHIVVLYVDYGYESQKMKEFLKSLILASLVILVLGLLGFSYFGGFLLHPQTQTNVEQDSQTPIVQNSQNVQDTQTTKSSVSQTNNPPLSNQGELEKLKAENQNLQNQLQTMTNNYNIVIASNQNLQTQLQQYREQLTKFQDITAKPYAVISNNTVNWYFTDSKGNKYHWAIPMDAYDLFVSGDIFARISTYDLKMPNGETISTYDYTNLVKYLSQQKEFRNVVDELYDNAGNENQFIYEVWHMVAEMTTYSKDITNNNLWPYEVLTRGEGDCKDKAILIADLLRSSSHTTNWDIHLVIMDIDNPTNPQTVNHMIVSVNTGQQNYLIEPTAKPDVNGLKVWTGTVTGWNVPFGPS